MLKYLLMSVAFAVALPGVLYLQSKVTVSVEIPKRKIQFRYGCVLLAVYALILFMIHAVRVGNYNYWGDEAYSIMLAKMNYAEMLNATAADVHPPLYYILLKLVCAVIGDSYYAYNITTLIPYAVFLILSVTIVRKMFGGECCAILITFAALLDSSIEFNAEARMYSLGLLFVFLSYIMLYKILHEKNSWNYVWFAVTSLCAAYTHYYCLLVVAFFYLALLVMAIADKKSWKPVLLTCFGTVAGYLPWFITLLRTLQRVSGGFWIEGYTPVDALLEYLFSGNFKEIFLCILIISTVVYFLKDLKIVSVNSGENGKYDIRIKLCNLRLSMEAIWIVIGLLSILGTMAIGLIASKLIRPVLLLRYLYPAAVIAWLALGVEISKMKWKKVISFAIILLTILSGWPEYQSVVAEEKQALQKLETTLQATSKEIYPEDQLMATHDHIVWTISRYYYPGVPCSKIDSNNIPEFDSGTTYWLIVKEEEISTVVQQLQEKNVTYEEAVSGGNLGTHNVNIYKVAR